MRAVRLSELADQDSGVLAHELEHPERDVPAG